MQLIANLSEPSTDVGTGGLKIRANATRVSDGWLLSVVVQREGQRLVAGLWVEGYEHQDSERLLSQQLGSIASAHWQSQGSDAHGHILSAKKAIESRMVRRPKVGEPTLSATQLRTAIALLGSELHVAMSVRDVSISCGISESHLRKGFRTCMGLSPQQWRQHERLKFCRKQLLETDDALSLIAKKAGFPVPNYFSRVFTQASGLPPSDWRRIFRSAMSGRSSLRSSRLAIASER